MNKTILATAAVMGLLAVILGALGAHALREVLPTPSLESFQTGVQYQMYHALFLLVLGGSKWLAPASRRWVFRLITAGVIGFSGSIYLLSTQALSGMDFSGIALVTPLGGLLLILGWAALLFNVVKASDRQEPA